ncbi:response regulator [Candidatus Bathyarchaeota archaeon]|nr:response regulator [Candidatus Bathyarchaeota archaeon]
MSKGKVIIVEDNVEVLESLSEILTSEGYEVETATSGEEGIKKCRTEQFSLALLDIKLPDMEGTQVLEVLHREFPGMVKIMITGHPSLENAVASLKRGADAYLMKPINPAKLLKVLDEKMRERVLREKA